QFGHMPFVFTTSNPASELEFYLTRLLRDEVQAEAYVRDPGLFWSFLEILATYQADLISAQAIGESLGVDRKTAQAYIDLVEDLLIGVRLPAFQRRAQRALITRPKFYFSDVGLYRLFRPPGTLEVD